MQSSTYRALLVGNSTFPEDPHNLPELKGPINDLALLRDALTNLTTGLFEPQHVRLVPERTKAQVLEAMERFFRSARRQDTLLLYYSGHGQQDAVGNLFLCARDTRTDYLVSTAISDSEINGIMRDSNAQTFVVILDCCHSGAFKGTATPAGLQGTGRFVLASSRRRELSADSEEDTGTSAFTSHLVDALRLGTLDRNGDGFVSLNDLYDHVLSGLRQATGQIPQRHIDNAVGDVVLARAVGRQEIGSPRMATPAHDRPILDLSDAYIQLSDAHVGEEVPPEVVEVFNRGGGELRWTAESADPWISITQERDRFWLHFNPRVGVNRGRVRVRDRAGGANRSVRVALRVREPAVESAVDPGVWPHHLTYQTPAPPRRRRYLAAIVTTLSVLVAAGAFAWSWLSDFSHAVGTYEVVAQTVARIHYYPVRSEYVCSDGVNSGIVVEVIIDYYKPETPLVTWGGVTDKGKTISAGTPVLLKVSNGLNCPR